MRYNRSQRWIGHGTTSGTARMHTICSSGMLINHIMIERSYRGNIFHQAGCFRQVLTNLHTCNGSINRGVIGSCLFLFCIAAFLRIKGIDLRHPSAKPQHHTVLGFSKLNGLRGITGAARHDCGRRCGRGLNEFSTLHSS